MTQLTQQTQSAEEASAWRCLSQQLVTPPLPSRQNLKRQAQMSCSFHGSSHQLLVAPVEPDEGGDIAHVQVALLVHQLVKDPDEGKMSQGQQQQR